MSYGPCARFFSRNRSVGQTDGLLVAVVGVWAEPKCHFSAQLARCISHERN